MSSPPAVRSGPVLVVAGMHRSGTSCVAGLLQSAGLFLGDRLLGGDPTNPSGHFEDLEFLDFHRRLLAAHGMSVDGFVAGVRIERFPGWAGREAADLVASRWSVPGPWGWKDPRTTLFLEAWHDIVPEARYLFVFRPPWEVVDSLFRRGDPAFARNPAFALQLWAEYNSRLLEFARGHEHRVLVRELSQVVTDPARLCDDIGDQLGVPLRQPRATVRPDLLHAAADRASLVAAASPACMAVLAELRSLAGSIVEPPDAEPAAAPERLEERLDRWRQSVRARSKPPAGRGREVFVGVPVYRGGAFVAETLRSIQNQDHREFRVCISLDGEDGAAEEACRPFLADPRFEMHVQPRRLGWAANLNWLMNRCTSEFFCFWQQDDLAATNFLDKLVTHASHYPEAVCVFADVQWFGSRIDRVESPSATGFALERVLRQIEAGDYVPFLGLIRGAVLPQVGPIRLTPHDSPLEDQVWLARLAGLGSWHRVPGTLYFKRGHASEAHLNWESLPHDAGRRPIWLEWGLGMLQAATAVAAPSEHGRLFEIVFDRLTRRRPGRWLFYDADIVGVEEQESMREELSALARERLGVVGDTDALLDRYAREVATRGSVELVTAGGEPGLAVLGGGWSDPESGGVWSDGTAAVLRLPIPDTGTWTVALHASPYPLGDPQRQVRVRAAGRTLASKTFGMPSAGEPEPLLFSVEGGRVVTIDLPWAVSPADLGGGPDGRRLGICLHRLTIRRNDGPDRDACAERAGSANDRDESAWGLFDYPHV